MIAIFFFDILMLGFEDMELLFLIFSFVENLSTLSIHLTSTAKILLSS